jgi:hypothetical protein
LTSIRTAPHPARPRATTTLILGGLLLVAVLLGQVCAAPAADPFPRLKQAGIQVDLSRSRPLRTWKPQIQAYSKRHYGEEHWYLVPRCIVLHYTAGADFPWNLVQSESFAGETPGLASHYVVDALKVWQILPPTVRSRGAYGINHRALNIEMVALDQSDLASNRKKTLESTARLVADLASRFRIPVEEIYSHEEVAAMNPSTVPWVLDLVNPEPYSKIDPGQANMAKLRARVAELMP